MTDITAKTGSTGNPQNFDEANRKLMDAITWARRLTSHIPAHLTPEQAANPKITAEMQHVGKFLASAMEAVSDLQLAVRATEAKAPVALVPPRATTRQP